MPGTVIISGATGYIAQHTVNSFLQKGYKVVGTVRSEAKGARLARLFNHKSFKYAIVPDIQTVGAFDQVLKSHPEAVGFIHTASPFFFDTDDPEKDLLTPAIQGTKNVLTSVTLFGHNVKRVVITSSYAAMYDKNEFNADFVRNEDSWNPISWEQALLSGATGYMASKVFAEKAAWEFVHMQKPVFSLCTINPSYVFGPQLFDEDVKETLNTSAEIINHILKLNPDSPIPRDASTWSDVKNVAEAHVAAFEKNEAAGHRLLVINGRFTGQGVLDLIRKQFPQLQSKLPVGKPGSSEAFLKRFCKLDDTRSRKVLDLKYETFETTICDSVAQILRVQAKPS